MIAPLDSSDTSPLVRARHAALVAAGSALAHVPFGRRAEGEPLTRVLRELPLEAERRQLIGAWAAALARLHAAGWGTDGAVASALWRPKGRTPCWDIGCVWPLGTLAARPVTALADWDELRAWLGSALGAEGLASAQQAVGTRVVPWPDYPASPAGVTIVAGPPAEVAAHAVGAGLALALPGDPLGWRAAGEALADGRPVIAPLATAWLGRALGVTAARTVLAEGCGGDPRWLASLGPEALEALGIAPALFAEPVVVGADERDGDRHRGLDGGDGDADGARERERARRALEDSALAETPEARARAEAEALLGLDGPLGAEDAPDGARLARLDAALVLARDARDRGLACRILTARAAAWRGRDPKRAFADLAEARRVANADRLTAIAADVAAVERLLALTEGAQPAAPVPALSGDATLLGQVARELGQLIDEPEAVLMQAARWLAMANLAIGSVAEEVALELVAELVAASAILAGREAAGERIIRRVEGPVAFKGFAGALVALLAARRGAVETTRAELVALGGEPETHARRAAICVVAARTAGLDGLVALFDADASLRPECRIAWCFAAGDERSARTAQGALAPSQLARWDDARIPGGAALALGLALRTSEPGRARSLLQRATGADEIHIEIQALTALAGLHTSGGAEAERIAERLATLLPRRPARAMRPLELTPDAVIDDVLAVLARAARSPTWPGAIAVVAGAIEGRPPAPEAAQTGLAILETGPAGREHYRLEAGGDPGHGCDLAGPLALPPERAARLLMALAPRYLETIATPEAPSDEALAAALDQDLCAARRAWTQAVQRPFKRRELTLGVLRALIRRGLEATHGLYRALAERWQVGDYAQFMAFLRRADALIDYRPYRDGRRGLRD